MQLREKIEQNIRDLQLHPIYKGQIIPVIPKQVALTQKWILPHEADILADLYGIRKEVDGILFSSPIAIEEKMSSDKEYPYGMCRPIRDAVYAGMIAGIELGKAPGLRTLRSFVEEGGILQPFWGIDKGLYFQNAIQIGDAILDVANDTVDPNKTPIVVYRSVASSPITPVLSFTEYARIAESYWGHQIFPNIYLPELAPIFPMLAIERRRKSTGEWSRLLVVHMDAAEMAYKNLYSERGGKAAGLAAHFLFDSPYASKRLPESLVAQLRTSPAIKDMTFTLDSSEAQRSFDPFVLENGKVTSQVLQVAEQIRQKGLKLLYIPLVEMSDSADQ